MGTAAIEPETYGYFIKDKQCAASVRFIPHILQKSRFRILKPAGLHDNCCKPLTVFVDNRLQFLPVIVLKNKCSVSKFTRNT